MRAHLFPILLGAGMRCSITSYIRSTAPARRAVLFGIAKTTVKKSHRELGCRMPVGKGARGMSLSG